MTVNKRILGVGLSLFSVGLLAGLLFLVDTFRYDDRERRLPTGRPAVSAKNLILHRPISVHDGGYIGADACRECHPDNFASWHDSYHRTMTQVASASAAVPSFDNVVLEFPNSSLGKVTLRQEGEQLWADFENRDTMGRSQIVRQPIVMMTGSHHAQGYWFPSGEGRDLKRFPFMYRCLLYTSPSPRD